MPSTDIIRTFIAVEIPDDIKAAMKEVQGTLRKTVAEVGWVRPEGVHLTLKFLGGIGADIIPDLGAAVEAAVGGVAPFQLSVRGVGVFPTPKAPRVVWLGVEGELDRLAELYECVEGACEGLGFKREDRPFKPHLTLGRVKSPKGRGALVNALTEFEGVELGAINVESVSVMKSELRPSGAIYTEMRRISMVAG